MTNDSLRRWLALAAPAALLIAVPLAACKSRRSTSPSPAPVSSAPDAAPVAASDPHGSDPSGSAPLASEPAPAPIRSTQDSEVDRAFEAARQAESVKDQRRSFLLSEYMGKGKDAFQHLEFQAARSAFASALEIDPTSQEARDWLAKTQAALGEVGPLRAQDLRDKSDLQVVRQAEARQQVLQSVLDGDRALEMRRFDEAIGSYRTAERILGFYPLLAGEQNELKSVAARIDEALRRKDEARREDEESQRRAATAERRERESQARRQLENQIRKLFSDANIAFVSDRPTEAIRNLDLLLEIDPKNERAQELRDIVQRSSNERHERDLRQRHRQEWSKVFSEAHSGLMPQTEIIVHDLDHWASIQDRTPLQFHANVQTMSAEDQAVHAALDTTAFQPQFPGVSIEEIVGYLRNLVQVNFVLSQGILDMDEGQKSVSLELPKRSVRGFLDALRLVKDFHWRVQDGYVRLGTAADMKGRAEQRTYDVADLTQIVPNFPGPDLTLVTPSGQGIPNPTDPDPEPIFSGDQIVTLIQSSLAPESWQDTEAGHTIRFVPSSSTLVVVQTPEVHGELERFLDDLRLSSNQMVEVQTRFLIAEDNFLEDIGVDWRGLGDNGNSGVPPVGGLGAAPPFDDFGASPLPGTPGAPGPLGTGNQPGFFTQTGNTPVLGKVENIFDQNLSGTNPLTSSGGLSMQWISLGDRQSELILRATEKNERVELVTAPRLLVHSNSRSHIAVTNQFAYVAGYGVEIAQASSIADPQIEVIQDGAILDVRPVVSADRKFVKLELRPTLATLALPIEQRTVGVGNGTPVTIQFPNLTIRKVRTTVIVPDGGTILLGGQSIDERRNESAGVPLLRDIPLIGFFFDRKGTSISKRRLLILLRVKIVIPTEYEPRIPAKASPLLQNVVDTLR